MCSDMRPSLAYNPPQFRTTVCYLDRLTLTYPTHFPPPKWRFCHELCMPSTCLPQYDYLACVESPCYTFCAVEFQRMSRPVEQSPLALKPFKRGKLTQGHSNNGYTYEKDGSRLASSQVQVKYARNFTLKCF